MKKATTTRYCDGSGGACGYEGYYHGVKWTAAGSPGLYGSGSWCGDGCGKCYKLTSTGAAPPGLGTGGTGSIIV